MVTLIRWAIEAVHGIISMKYKLFHHQFDNKILHNAHLYCKIAGFLVNKFGKSCVSKLSTDKEVLAQIKQQNTKENTLAVEAESGRWSGRKVPFRKLTSSDILDFPDMSENDLKIFFTGTYQLHQSICYLAEMMNEDNKIELS